MDAEHAGHNLIAKLEKFAPHTGNVEVLCSLRVLALTGVSADSEVTSARTKCVVKRCGYLILGIYRAIHCDTGVLIESYRRW